MSSMALHQENAPLFQYAKSKSFSQMSFGISLPQTALSFFKRQRGTLTQPKHKEMYKGNTSSN